MKPADQIASVAIIGNGLMGQGISQVFARAGKRVTQAGAGRGHERSGSYALHPDAKGPPDDVQYVT